MLAVINDTGILVVLVAAVLLFGASRIPKLARNLGEASKEFKKAQDDVETGPGSEPLAVGQGAKPETVTLSRAQLDELLNSAGHRPAAANPTP
jgi:TatA/E family protein of Tat protein translocase